MTDSSCWQKERERERHVGVGLGVCTVFTLHTVLVIYVPDLKLAPHVLPIFGEFCRREQFSVWLFRIHPGGLAGMVR